MPSPRAHGAARHAGRQGGRHGGRACKGPNPSKLTCFVVQHGIKVDIAPRLPIVPGLAPRLGLLPSLEPGAQLREKGVGGVGGWGERGSARGVSVCRE